MKKHLPGIIIFLTGFVTMAFEIGGARVLGPYFGTSVFVWTSLIGIIMGSLSLGYWLGGWISVKRTDFVIFSLMLSFSALFIAIAAIGNIYILDRVVKYIPGFRWQTVIASLSLFGPASLFFGMVLPYGVKLKITSVNTSGGTVGNLYAVSTIGSILGTFAAGFYLVPAFGFTNVLFTLAVLMVLLSGIVALQHKKLLSSLLVVTVSVTIVFMWNRTMKKEVDYIDIDTQYSRVIIYETEDAATGRPVKMLRVNDENSSAMFLDGSDDLVFEVLKYYRLVEHFKPDFKSALMIGGSGYAFPKYYLNKYPVAKLDVVEIDPGLTDIARRHFSLTDHPNLRVIHEDGRTFLNRRDRRYDALFMDAYKSMITIPYQLTTREAVQGIYDVLVPDGVVFANIISTLDSENNQFLHAEVATYKSVFKKVMLFAVQYPKPTNEEKMYFQNIILVGLKSDEGVNFYSQDPKITEYLSHYFELDLNDNIKVLTDEYAPVEYFTSKVLK